MELSVHLFIRSPVRYRNNIHGAERLLVGYSPGIKRVDEFIEACPHRCAALLGVTTAWENRRPRPPAFSSSALHRFPRARRESGRSAAMFCVICTQRQLESQLCAAKWRGTKVTRNYTKKSSKKPARVCASTGLSTSGF